jgi:predicted amidophosphoribosyltransferase
MTDRPEPLQKILLRHTEDLLFPRRCPVCDRPVRPFGADICPECAPETGEKFTDLYAGSAERCCRMKGKSTVVTAAGTGILFSSGASTFTYRSASGAIYRYKYEGRQEYAGFFSRAMAERLRMQDPGRCACRSRTSASGPAVPGTYEKARI